jgi:hypothetical protein
VPGSQQAPQSSPQHSSQESLQAAHGITQQDADFAATVADPEAQSTLHFSLTLDDEIAFPSPQQSSQTSQHVSHPAEQDGQGTAQQEGVADLETSLCVKKA